MRLVGGWPPMPPCGLCVVPAEPAGECFGAVAAGGVDVGVGPFALQDADEGFGFAVCPWGVGLGADVADVVLGEQAAKRV
jgi:hypothetical protein